MMSQALEPCLVSMPYVHGILATGSVLTTVLTTWLAHRRWMADREYQREKKIRLENGTSYESAKPDCRNKSQGDDL